MKKSDFRFINYRIGKIDSMIAESFGRESENLKQSIDIVNEISADNPRKIKVILKIKINSESGNFHFNVDVVGYFDAHPEMEEEMFRRVCEISAPAILLPYARSIITNFTAQCNVKPIILPLFNLTKPKEETTEKD